MFFHSLNVFQVLLRFPKWKYVYSTILIFRQTRNQKVKFKMFGFRRILEENLSKSRCWLELKYLQPKGIPNILEQIHSISWKFVHRFKMHVQGRTMAHQTQFRVFGNWIRKINYYGWQMTKKVLLSYDELVQLLKLWHTVTKFPGSNRSIEKNADKFSSNVQRKGPLLFS